jgi:hypothetical protein
MRSFAEQLPEDNDHKGVYLFTAGGPTPEVAYFLRRRTLYLSLKRPAPGEDDPVIVEARSLKRQGYRLEGLVELFPGNFVDPEVRSSILELLDLEEWKVFSSTDSCRASLLRSIADLQRDRP